MCSKCRIDMAKINGLCDNCRHQLKVVAAVEHLNTQLGDDHSDGECSIWWDKRKDEYGGRSN